ncbi:hypothetical protein GOODEAATRI_028459 [Goodea atripinnis]|uniref:HECT domain-containing protein n=1 Tax=Goodea atripinnis TaxID=208336 RepID=A0ABV0MVX7_9TELE
MSLGLMGKQMCLGDLTACWVFSWPTRPIKGILGLLFGMLIVLLEIFLHCLKPTLIHSHRGRSSKPIFVQIAKQVVNLNPLELRLPSRAWKVKLVGEGADDAGGVFDDTITEMFLLNPGAHSEDHMVQFRFLGILMAVAIRTKKPLDLYLAPWVWKQLCCMPLTGADLEEVDLLTYRTLQGILHLENSGITADNFHVVRSCLNQFLTAIVLRKESLSSFFFLFPLVSYLPPQMIPLDSFMAHSADGRRVPVVPRGQNISLTFSNRTEYVERALDYRLHEMDSQVWKAMCADVIN